MQANLFLAVSFLLYSTFRGESERFLQVVLQFEDLNFSDKRVIILRNRFIFDRSSELAQTSADFREVSHSFKFKRSFSKLFDPFEGLFLTLGQQQTFTKLPESL